MKICGFVEYRVVSGCFHFLCLVPDWLRESGWVIVGGWGGGWLMLFGFVLSVDVGMYVAEGER